VDEEEEDDDDDQAEARAWGFTGMPFNLCAPPPPELLEEGEKEKEGADTEGKGEKQVFFAWKGKRYLCSAKEKVILLNQKKTLDATGFEKLFLDFDLKELPKK